MTHIVFLHSDKPREVLLAGAFTKGVEAHGCTFEMRRLGDLPDTRIGDIACMVGVKSVELWRRCRDLGMQTLYLDKGYSRHRGGSGGGRTWEYWRVSPNAHHPTSTSLMAHAYPRDRMDRMEWLIENWRMLNSSIIIAGSSEKYHRFYDLCDPTTYAEKIIRRLRKHTDRPIIYRPKPSWRDARPISGVAYSRNPETLGQLLLDAHCVVTHGSNACFDAVLAGVPTVILGDGVTKPISSTDLSEIERPRTRKRIQLLQNLAYHQYTEAEFESGEAWNIIGGWFAE